MKELEQVAAVMNAIEGPDPKDGFFGSTNLVWYENGKPVAVLEMDEDGRFVAVSRA